MWQIVAGVAVGLVAGALVSAAIVRFWDDIKEWLNHTAADAVERALGHDARKNMHRAVVAVDRIIDKVRNTGTVYSRNFTLDKYYTKVTYTAEAPASEIEADVLKEINSKGQLVNEFNYQ